MKWVHLAKRQLSLALAREYWAIAVLWFLLFSPILHSSTGSHKPEELRSKLLDVLLVLELGIKLPRWVGVGRWLVGSAENIATQPRLAGAWAELGNRKFGKIA